MNAIKKPKIKNHSNKVTIISIIITLFVSNILYSNEKVTLKTGIPYEIETQGGKPPQLMEEDFKIITIEPTIIRYSKPLDYNFTWHLELSIRNDRFEKIVIESLGGDMKKYFCNIDPVPETLSRGKKYPWTTIKANFMPEFSHPNTWESFSKDETFWMGFKLTFLPINKEGEPVIRQQWVKLFNWEKRKWLDRKKTYQDEIPKYRKTYNLTIQDGRKFTASTWNGSVEFKDDDFIKIYTIAPILLANNKNGDAPALSWTFDAIIHREGHHHIIIQNSNGLKEQQSASLLGRTPIKLRFFPHTDYPQMWSWLLETGDSWVPFSITIKSDGEENVRELIEWVLITSANKGKILKIINPLQ